MSEIPGHLLKKIEVYPNYECNRNCRFCFTSKDNNNYHSKPISFHSICEKIYIGYKEGCRMLTVLGGEPTVYDKLPNMLAFANKIGYIGTVLFSNGLKFADYSYAKKIASLKLKAVHLNIPSHEPDSFNYLTQSEHGYDALLQAIRNLKALSIPMIAVCVITKQNYDKLAEYVDFYYKSGISFFIFHYAKLQGNLDPLNEKNAENIKSIVVPISEAAKGLKKMLEHCLKANIFPPFIETMPPCVLDSYAYRITDFIFESNKLMSELRIIPGMRLHINKYDSRIKISECTDCIWEEKCYGIEKAYIKLFGKNEFKAVKGLPQPYYNEIPEEKRTPLFISLPELMEKTYIDMHGGED